MDLSGLTDNFFPTPSPTFTDNLAQTISAGATEVEVNNASEYDDGDIVALTVDPGTANEATFIGVKSGNEFEECVWTEGNTAVGHDAGATIIDYVSATHVGAISKGIKQFANDDGSLKQQPVRDALGLEDAASAGWEVAPYTFSVQSGYNKGNKSFEVRADNVDVTDEYSAGMRMKFSRSTTPPTQAADLEASSSQYASKTTPTGITFTDDFTCEAWVKLEGYTAVSQGIVARRNADTEGWSLSIDPSGAVKITSLRIASNNRTITTAQSVPLNRWVHIAASMDNSGGVYAIYIDGVAVPTSTSTAGTITALVQGTTALVVGAEKSAGTGPFDGKIADVRVWSAVRTADEIRDNMNQQLVGSETNLVAYYKLNGNFNDSTANANNMTGSGGAVATDVDNPMKSIEYGIITKVSYSAPHSTITLFTGTDHAIPNMTLSSPFYSTQDTPFGFPRGREKWTLRFINKTDSAWASGYLTVLKQTIPLGSWELGYKISVMAQKAATTAINVQTTLSTTNSSISDDEFFEISETRAASGTIRAQGGHEMHKPVQITTPTDYYLLLTGSSAPDVVSAFGATYSPSEIYAECGYL